MEQRFFCYWSRWPFTLKGGFGRFLEMSLAERPDHDVKWPRLMVAMKIDFKGLKSAAWKYLASFRLVAS